MVQTASTTAEAIAQLEAADFDVIFVDQKLQGRAGPDSGLDLLSEIRRLQPEAKTIMVTGYASPESIERAFSLETRSKSRRRRLVGAAQRGGRWQRTTLLAAWGRLAPQKTDERRDQVSPHGEYLVASLEATRKRKRVKNAAKKAARGAR